MRAASLRVLAALLLGPWAGAAIAHGGKQTARLPVVGPAPAFVLTTADGARFALAEARGQVLAVTFIYATCRDSCPVLAAKLVGLQRKLGRESPRNVRFVAITVDPETDTPRVLRAYAEAIGADPAGWSFLTGDPGEVRRVVSEFGAFSRRNSAGGVDHLYITSLVDRQGAMRVQYLGHRFDPDAMLQDLRSLASE
jgi:protein SCO1/2